jgi:signal transduction histidine kinase
MVSHSPKPGRVALVAAIATLAIFGALVVAITWQLRARLRGEVLRREAEAIHAVALMQIGRAEARLSDFVGGDAMQDVFDAVLESSRLRGVLAVQLFDRNGKVRASLQAGGSSATIDRWWDMGLERPEARYHAKGRLEDALGLPPEPGVEPTLVPLLEIVVPLRIGDARARHVGAARYWIDGEPVAAEFKLMNRALWLPAGVAFLGGALLISLVLAWAYSRLAQANRQLVEQSADLARANQELDFAAKTGALGAISAHLIHGLKNPLAGIEGFVADAASGASDGTNGEACRTAMETTKRLRALVNEVTTVLRDEADGDAAYQVPLEEIVEAARMRAAPAAEQAGIALTATGERDAKVSARTANLAGLVLANLVTNALEASPRGTRVAIEARRQNGNVEFLVSDAGPGLPGEVREALFRPVRSAKRGGGGVGLAISHRLAKHAGGDLELVHSDATGTVFRLRVPTAG